MKRFQVPGPSVFTHTQSQRHFDIIQVLVGYTGSVSLQYEEYRRFKLFVLVLVHVLGSGTIIPVLPLK
jgi:hypothetical protein